MKYPHVLSEDKTLDLVLAGASIARYGDGEWRCAVGGGCTSQRPDPKLAVELRDILHSQHRQDKLIVGIPNPFAKEGAPRKESWIRYTEDKYAQYLTAKTYASSFITRPDNAPWIDTPEFWRKVCQLWKGQDVILVVGNVKDGTGPEKKSITSEMIKGEVKSLFTVVGPRQHAYAEIDRVQRDIEDLIRTVPNARVLLCLGATATVLAARLAAKGIHAIDTGHIGMFLRHAGAYRYQQDDLSTPEYRAQLVALHRKQSWGTDGHSHAPEVEKMAVEFNAATILDYGSGEGTLAEAMLPRRVSCYDPGIPGSDKMPKPCDLVACTDVMEHVEPDRVEVVLDHIYRLTGKAAYFVIATRPARAVLPDGRNAHISLHDADWWVNKIKAAGFTVYLSEIRKAVNIWARK